MCVCALITGYPLFLRLVFSFSRSESKRPKSGRSERYHASCGFSFSTSASPSSHIHSTSPPAILFACNPVWSFFILLLLLHGIPFPDDTRGFCPIAYCDNKMTRASPPTSSDTITPATKVFISTASFLSVHFSFALFARLPHPPLLYILLT